MGFLTGQIREVVAAVDGLLRGARPASGDQIKSIDVQRPGATGDMSGRAVDGVRRVQEGLSASLDRIQRADSELTAVIREMNERSATLRSRLEGIRAAVLEVQRQEASATTTAQRHELAAIVAAKTVELRQVMTEAQTFSAAAAGRIEAVTAQYRQAGPDPSPTDPPGTLGGAPPEDQPPMTDSQSGLQRGPEGPTITSAPTYPMGTEQEPGPPRDEDHPRISDAQGGLHRAPDGPTIKSAPTYPMDDDRL